MIGAPELIAAFFLDLVIGDPRWLPHPVRIIGTMIVQLENLLRRLFKEKGERLAGVLLVSFIVLPSVTVTFWVVSLLGQAASGFFAIISKAVLIYCIGTTIALRELIASAKNVISAIKAGTIDDARKKLSMIVGRDTSELSEDGVLRAAIETLAENLSDGVIAPVFYLALGGLPLAIAYKAINTLDSMVGYKNERYIHFGWAAARLDDIANYIPSRISGLLVVAASLVVQRTFASARSAMAILLRDGRNHTSPNSGLPEAAMAGALGVRLGGPSTYGGVLSPKPYIGDLRDNDYLSASEKASRIVFTASAIFVIVTAIVLEIARPA